MGARGGDRLRGQACRAGEARSRRHERATGRCGRSSSAPGAGCATSTSAAVHAPDAEMALQNARDVYTRRGEGVSLWVVPTRHHRRRPRRAGRDVRSGRRQDLPPPDLLRACPTKSSTCEAVAATRFADYALRHGDDALVLAQRLLEWCTHAPEIEEDIALAQPRARSARPGARAAHATPARSRARVATRTTSRTGATSATSSTSLLVEQPNGDFAHAIVRQFLSRRYQLALYERLSRSAGRRRSPASPARRRRRSPTTSPRRAVDAATRRRHGGEPRAAQAALETGSGRTRPSCSKPTRSTSRSSPPAWRSTRPSCAARGEPRSSDVARARRRSSVPTAAGTPSGGRTGRHSEGFAYLLAEMQLVARCPSGSDVVNAPALASLDGRREIRTRSCRCSRSATSASCAVRGDAGRHRRRHAHADVHRMPRDRTRSATMSRGGSREPATSRRRRTDRMRPAWTHRIGSASAGGAAAASRASHRRGRARRRRDARPRPSRCPRCGSRSTPTGLALRRRRRARQQHVYRAAASRSTTSRALMSAAIATAARPPLRVVSVEHDRRRGRHVRRPRRARQAVRVRPRPARRTCAARSTGSRYAAATRSARRRRPGSSASRSGRCPAGVFSGYAHDAARRATTSTC